MLVVPVALESKAVPPMKPLRWRSGAHKSTDGKIVGSVCPTEADAGKILA